MPLYEHVYLARQDLSAQQVEELTTTLSGVVGQMGGKVTKNEYWGLKSRTYRIRKNRKAHMTLLNVDAPPAALNEIERQERLHEDVLRYLTIRVDALEDGPRDDAQIGPRPRADRGDRGGRDDRGETAANAADVTRATTLTVLTPLRGRNSPWHWQPQGGARRPLLPPP